MHRSSASEALAFPRSCVATPHHLASAAGLAVLADGGNAIDAVVAANLTLGVVAPYTCGYGGDLFALVWREDEGLWAYNGSGRAPAAASVDAVRTAAGSDAMPSSGPLTVTVPGAVDGWFELLARFGTMSFGRLAGAAIAYADQGFVLSGRGGATIERSKDRFASAPEWWAIYGDAGPGTLLRQPALGRTIRALAEHGPDALYGGPIGRSVADHVRSSGGLLSSEDLASHRGEPVTPMRSAYRDVEVVELPPNTQGVAVLEALAITESLSPDGIPADGVERQHLLIESTKLALADRDALVSDPDAMATPASGLLAPGWIADRAAAFDPARAGSPLRGRVAGGGTAYLCAADADGTMVSLIQSNYMGFGSGVTVPEWGMNLQNRGAYFSLEPSHANVVAPRKRTLHTLIPAMVLRDGRPWAVFGTMGGDGQAQTHVQLMVRMVDDAEDPQRAVDAPRWVVSTADHAVVADDRFGHEVLAALEAKEHRVSTSGWFDPVFGHAHAIVRANRGYLGATDPRCEGSVLGL
jgi:gamma-glutamyltranspeptidase/glutathione hydrolase